MTIHTPHVVTKKLNLAKQKPQWISEVFVWLFRSERFKALGDLLMAQSGFLEALSGHLEGQSNLLEGTSALLRDKSSLLKGIKGLKWPQVAIWRPKVVIL